MTTDLTDGRWTFYDQALAFPTLPSDFDRTVVAEIHVSLDHPDGGTLGEFGIVFHDFRDHGTAMQLRVFDDAFDAFEASGIVAVLRALTERAGDRRAVKPADVRDALAALGWHDRTDELAAPYKAPAPAADPMASVRAVLDEWAGVAQHDDSVGRLVAQIAKALPDPAGQR